MVEQNLLTIYKNKVSISCYSEFHAITGNHQTTKELLTVAYCLLTSRRFLACAGGIHKQHIYKQHIYIYIYIYNFAVL